MNPAAYEPLKSKLLNRSEKGPGDCPATTSAGWLWDHFKTHWFWEPLPVWQTTTKWLPLSWSSGQDLIGWMPVCSCKRGAEQPQEGVQGRGRCPWPNAISEAGGAWPNTAALTTSM